MEGGVIALTRGATGREREGEREGERKGYDKFILLTQVT